MHTIDLLQEVLRISSQGGWQVRCESHGSGGGACRLGNEHLLFVDQSLTANEQLEQVVFALRDYLSCPKNAQDPFVARFRHLVQSASISDQTRRCLNWPKP